MTKLLTVKQMAEWFGVIPLTIYRWKDDGMPHIRVGASGRSIRFDLDEVEKWMEEKSNK